MKRRYAFLSGILASCGMLAASLPARAQDHSVKAVVVRSTGTMFLGMTIWSDLNSGWSAFGDVPVQIDYTTLGGYGWGLPEIQATDADVLILSNPAFLTYTTNEIAAIQQYVQAGHGLIISYGKFRSADRALAPLVGLSEANQIGTNTWPDPFTFEGQYPIHPVFSNVSFPYVTGVRTLASPSGEGIWDILNTATVLARATPEFQEFTGDGVIVANEGEGYRGLYFSHYIEDKSGGANQQDMQVFYNGLVWAGTPEPASALLLIVGSAFLSRGRARKRLERTPAGTDPTGIAPGVEGGL